jgi:hypothetical protein
MYIYYINLENLFQKFHCKFLNYEHTHKYHMI